MIFGEVFLMHDEKEDNKMFANTLSKRKSVKKPKLARNKFANLSKNDWKEANEQSKKGRGISGLTYRDIYGR